MIILAAFINVVGIALAQEAYVCGTPKLSAISAHVVGGTETVPGFLPWNLRLELSSDSMEYELICGGVLIDPGYALTAARCIVDDPEYYRVVAGSLGEDLSGYEQYLDIAQIYVHPEFNDSLENFPNDIAILELANVADISEDAGPVHPICLPPSDDTVYWENPSCYASGYGMSESENGTYPDDLQQAWVDVIRDVQCELWWGEETLLPTQQCAYDQINRSFSLCEGDLGTPLSCMVDGRFDLAGVGSVFREDCNPRFASVYTSTPSYLDWIVEITGVPPRQD